ncbi:MAG: hypothetical protein E2598_09990 [Sphingobium sp.]|nr:hypothetical protein [Sphingobium sp.]
MTPEEQHFMQENHTLAVCEHLADIAIIGHGEHDAPGLLMGAALSALNRTMTKDQSIEMAKRWLQTLLANEGKPSAFN